MELSKEQLEAVYHKDGPALCIAGPGSGKTAVIVRRVENLINDGINPEDILVVTFARAAARSMEERFLQKNTVSGVRFSTIHSVCYGIIKKYGERNLLLIPDDVRRNFIYKKISDDSSSFLNATEKNYRDICMELSRFKSHSDNTHFSEKDELELLSSYNNHFIHGDFFKKFYPEYKSFLMRNNYYDFDDMSFIANDIMKKNKAFCNYLLADEFQDTSLIQLKLLKSIVSNDNLFVVGDDDQSVYSFRGASPEVLKSFCRDYPDCRLFHLNTNYRCNDVITSAAASLIKENKQRFSKYIKSVHKATGKAQGLNIKQYKTQHDELSAVVSFLSSEEYEKGKSFALLARTNHEASVVCCMLKRAGISFKSALKNTNPFDHICVKIIISFIRASLNKASMSDYINIFKLFQPPIPAHIIKACFSNDSEVFFERLNNIKDFEIFKNAFKDLRQRLKLMSDMPPALQILFVRNALGADFYFKSNGFNNECEKEIIEEKIESFCEFAKDFSTAQALLKFIESKPSDAPYISQNTNVNVLTMHASKGLEFDIVWIADFNEGIIPYKRAVEKGMTEEERRLFYVGMTRAKERLIISSHKSFGSKSCRESEFFKSIASFS